jgi:hypothetical protein
MRKLEEIVVSAMGTFPACLRITLQDFSFGLRLLKAAADLTKENLQNKSRPRQN